MHPPQYRACSMHNDIIHCRLYCHNSTKHHVHTCFTRPATSLSIEFRAVLVDKLISVVSYRWASAVAKRWYQFFRSLLSSLDTSVFLYYRQVCLYREAIGIARFCSPKVEYQADGVVDKRLRLEKCRRGSLLASLTS